MTTAVITLLDTGEAVFELGGLTHLFVSERAAVREAEIREMPHVVADSQARPPVVVLATV